MFTVARDDCFPRPAVVPGKAVAMKLDKPIVFRLEGLEVSVRNALFAKRSGRAVVLFGEAVLLDALMKEKSFRCRLVVLADEV